MEKPTAVKIEIVADDEESRGSAVDKVLNSDESDEVSDEDTEEEITESKEEELEEEITEVFDGFKLNMPSLLFYFFFLMRR